MYLSDILQEMTKGESSYMNKELNGLFKSLGFNVIITNHVLERVSNQDGREAAVSPSEVISAFKKAITKHKTAFKLCIEHKQLVEVVLHDSETRLNIPFKIDCTGKDKRNGENAIVLITIMRKDPSKFKSYGYNMNV